jgi:hypothetical protein
MWSMLRLSVDPHQAQYGCAAISRARSARGLPAYRLGKRLVFDLREVDDWIERGGGYGCDESATIIDSVVSL